MNLKNYTSSKPAHRTISYIEAYLADCGVSGVIKEYEDKVPVSLMFNIKLGNQSFTIKLPARVAEVHEYIWRDYVTGKKRRLQKTKADFLEQATRTAWKIQQDWVQVQMSLIKLKQVDFLEVFMGFLWDGKRSFYQELKGGGFKALPERCE